MAARNSAFLLVLPILSSSSSIASTGDSRENSARRRRYGVVGAGQPGDRIEEDDDVLLLLDQALRLFNDHLRDLHVTLRQLVEGGRDDLAAHGALHVGHFLRPLVDEQDDE